MGEYMNKLYWYKCGVWYVYVLMHECDNVNMNMIMVLCMGKVYWTVCVGKVCIKFQCENTCIYSMCVCAYMYGYDCMCYMYR